MSTLLLRLNDRGETFHTIRVDTMWSQRLIWGGVQWKGEGQSGHDVDK